ncbi:LacI family DNA-binding transcriptional regulator [Amantichitinum ursilacus]|uniref:HTH-type transcriptional regulator GntR n=1 Tax=Amantichitinum ursilacus TaxID=857265 RepID=A0A0N1JT34_9NEIS|nr:LacI family DNA-binding transcriptional regulator [Amantichitinum ursilacus]KPC54208.1 HTH-type transcriptional regulator GntR [Amantichitinum ursilacus]
MDRDHAPRKRRSSGRATVHDVAELAGVSAITVSRFFKNPDKVSSDLRGKIEGAVATLGYVPNLIAGGLASVRGRIVGMVIPNISGPIFANTIQSFSDALTRHGYQLLLASSYFDVTQEESAVRAFLGWNPAALVLTGQYHSPATEKMIEQAGVPVVETWDLQPQRLPIQVGFSNEEVGRLAARYLLDKGYRRIAYVQNSQPGDISAMDRGNGYAEIVRAAGLEPWFFIPTQAAPFEAGKQGFEAMVKRGADAVIFANDNLAAGAILAGQRAGIRIPAQCAVFGFGDYSFSDKLLPSLTTIQPPAHEMGLLAAERILQQLGEISGDCVRINELQCRVIARESA